MQLLSINSKRVSKIKHAEELREFHIKWTHEGENFGSSIIFPKDAVIMFPKEMTPEPYIGYVKEGIPPCATEEPNPDDIDMEIFKQ